MHVHSIRHQISFSHSLSLTHTHTLRSEGALEAVRVSSITGVPSSVEGRELGTPAPLVISGSLSSEGDLGEERVIISWWVIPVISCHLTSCLRTDPPAMHTLDHVLSFSLFSSLSVSLSLSLSLSRVCKTLHWHINTQNTQ